MTKNDCWDGVLLQNELWGGKLINETGITLREALKLSPLNGFEIVAGRDYLDNVITRVNIMADLEILNWIEEGEFLLTTAVHFSNVSYEEQDTLIRAMREKGVEAIAIKIKPYMKCLDPRILKLASDIGLPIIEMDYAVSFADIMEPVLKEIFEQQSKIIRKVESVHNDMMHVVLRGGNLEEMATHLGERIGKSIVVKDYYFDEIICSKESEEQSKNLEKQIDDYFKKHNIPSKSTKTSKYKIVLNNKEQEVFAIPIVARNTVYGHVFLIDNVGETTSIDVRTIESAASVIALELLKKISIQEVENKYKIEFFDDLISTDKVRKSKAIERSTYYKFDKDAHYCTLSIALKVSGDAKDRLETLNRDISKVMYLVDQHFDSKQLTYLVANRKSKVNVVLMFKNIDDHEAMLKNIYEELENVLIKRMGVVKFVIGVGRIYQGLDKIYNSLMDSQKAVEASEHFTDDRIIEFDTLGIYKIFSQLEVKDELIDFYEKTLKTLVAYDQKKDTELVKTLQVYYQCNGNLKKMSEKLFTHYNTVLYRVNRIQEISNCNLENEQHRYSLQTALKIMEMYGIYKTRA